MRTSIILLLLGTFTYIASAQEKTKYWVFLTDKLEAFGKSSQVEQGYLSDEAVIRRARRGIPGSVAEFASQDAPISNVYEFDLQELGFEIEHKSRWLNAITIWLTEDEVAKIAALPYVSHTRPVAHLSTDLQPSPSESTVIAERISSDCPSDYFGYSCPQLDIVNAMNPLLNGINGKGITLGFVDTNYGVDGSDAFNHTALKHIRDSGRLKEVRDFTNRDASQLCGGTHSHGMSVTSVAAGFQEGWLVGPGHGATIYAAVTECAPYERNIEEDNFVAAVEWMESKGVDVINSSLQYLDFDQGQKSYTTDDLDGNTGLTTIAMDLASKRGVVAVASVGNSGPGALSLGTPADGDSVISVGAVTSQRDVVPFSSRGPTSDGRIKPDVSAQGFQVLVAANTDDGYTRFNGTSFSSPMVAGIVTQILQVNPTLNPKEVWTILTSTASQASSPDNNLGWGIVDAELAVNLALSQVNRSNEVPPSAFELTVHSPYPNPFQNVVHFTIEANRPVSHARLTIFDVMGREVATVYNGSIRTGALPVQFDGRNLSPGVYAYTLEYDGKTQSGTLTRLGF